MSIQIRNFGEEDSVSVIEIHDLCKNRFQFRELTPEFLSELSHMPEFKFVVAVLDGRVIGFAGVMFYETLKLSEFGPVAVHPDYRNRGIGSEFIKYLLEFLMSKKITGITVRVKSDNPVAIKFFEKFGFKIEARFRISQKNTHEIIWLVKFL